MLASAGLAFKTPFLWSTDTSSTVLVSVGNKDGVGGRGTDGIYSRGEERLTGPPGAYARIEFGSYAPKSLL